MPTIDPGRLRPGMKIVIDGQLWVVTDFQLRTPGNLRSFVVVKLKSLTDGRVVEKTFRGAGEYPEQAEVEKRKCQFLYSDEMGFNFMDLNSYEQFTLSPDFIGGQSRFLMPDAEVQVQFWNGNPIGLELPLKMAFTVVDTVDEVSKGNSSGNITKVMVNTETGDYIERA